MSIREVSFCLIVICGPFPANGQEKIAELPTRPDGSVEGFFLGDSLLFRVLEDPISNLKKRSSGYLVLEDGTIQDLDLRPIDEERLLWVSCSGQTYFYYTITSKSKASQLKIYAADALASPSTPGKIISCPGEFLGGFVKEKSFIFLFLIKKTSTLGIYELKAGDLVSSKTISIPFPLNRYIYSEMAFIPPGIMTRINSTVFPVKFYLHGQTIGLTIDDYANVNEPDKAIFKTSIFRHNLVTGEQDLDILIEPVNRLFRSYLNHEFLYRITPYRDGAKLIAFNLEINKMILEKFIPGDSLPGITGYLRLGAEHSIQRLPMKKGSLSLGSDVSVVADHYDNTNVLTIGNWSNYKGMMGPASVLSPLLGIAVGLAGTALMQLKEDPNNTLYFYLKGNPYSGFTQVLDADQDGRNNGLLKKKIDDYEVATHGPRTIAYKAYVDGPASVIAVYRFAGAPVYQIVKFNKDPHE